MLKIDKYRVKELKMAGRMSSRKILLDRTNEDSFFLFVDVTGTRDGSKFKVDEDVGFRDLLLDKHALGGHRATT